MKHAVGLNLFCWIQLNPPSHPGQKCKQMFKLVILAACQDSFASSYRFKNYFGTDGRGTIFNYGVNNKKYKIFRFIWIVFHWITFDYYFPNTFATLSH